MLAYDYATRHAVLDDASSDVHPHLYPLCISCADGLTPPIGWILEDRRIGPALFASDAELEHVDQLGTQLESGGRAFGL
jgi:hypothetical protein